MIEDWFRGILTDGILSNLSGLFDSVNTEVGEIATQVGTTPAGWNAGIFNMIRSLSENVIVPIAGVIITFVMCYELIQLVIEKNNLHDLDTWIFFKWIFKTFVAVLLVTNTWNIVMGVFDITQSVVNDSAGVIISDTSIDIATVITDIEAKLDAMSVGGLLGLWFQSLFVGLTMKALSICIMLQLHALHKGESSAKAGDKFLCAALHIGSDIFAVGAGIGQKPFFIKGLRIVKGLFRRKPIQTVCFPLQGGEVKQFRRGCGLFLFFKGSTNGLRFLASRFHLPRRRFVVLPFGKGGNAANVQPDDMIFLFLKAADCIVAVYQHSKGGRLHSADIQCFMVEDREKAGRVNANEPIGLCSAKRGLIEVVIAAPVFEI